MSDHLPAGGVNREDVRAFGRWVRLLRTSRGLTQEQVALKAGIGKNIVGRIERGETSVGIAYVWPLARALEVRPQDLFAEPEPDHPLQLRRPPP